MKIFLGSLIKIYDIETLANCFLYMDIDSKTDISDLNNIDSSQINVFVIHYSRNDIDDLYNHLFRDKMVMTGYNNDSFDYPILHHFINHYNEYKDLDAEEVARKLYSKAQSIIEETYTVVSNKNKFISQVDLYKIHHFDGMAKSSSC